MRSFHRIHWFLAALAGGLFVLVMVGVIALVCGHWALTTKHALDHGIFNFDSLWYHLPFAADMVQSHSVTGMHYVDTVFTNWLYPQNSELLHATGMLLTGRDTLSLFINYGWLAMAFLTAWLRNPAAIPLSCRAYSFSSTLPEASTARTSSRSTVPSSPTPRPIPTTPPSCAPLSRWST